MSISSINRGAAAALAALALAACSNVEPSTEAQKVSAPVEVVQASSIPDTRVASGSVRAAVVSPLSSKVMGNVMRVLVREGDRVKAGQLLLEIDGRDVMAQSDRARAGQQEIESALRASEAAISGAEANATMADATFKRFSALRERNSVSPQEFDEASARQKAAAAELERARRTRAQIVAQKAGARASYEQAAAYVGYTRIHSPVDGVVTGRFIDPGAQAAPGVPLLTVESSGRSRVETTVDEAAVIRVGDPVTLSSGEATLQATVTQVVASVNPMTRSSIVKIDLPASAPFRAGGYVNVAFTAGRRSAITVPAGALVRRGQLTSVYVVDGDGKARLRLVTLGDPLGERIEILSGLEVGEKIVTRTGTDLKDGVLVADERGPNAEGRGTGVRS